MGEIDPLNRRHTLVYISNYGLDDGEGLRRIRVCHAMYCPRPQGFAKTRGSSKNTATLGAGPACRFSSGIGDAILELCAIQNLCCTSCDASRRVTCAAHRVLSHVLSPLSQQQQPPHPPMQSMSQHSLRRRSSFGLQSSSSAGPLTRKMSVISPSALTGHLNQDVVVQVAILVSVCMRGGLGSWLAHVC